MAYDLLFLSISDAVIPRKFKLRENVRIKSGIKRCLNMKKLIKSFTNSVIFSTLYENVPQFLVVSYEMFDFGFSVNFIQAANPIFTVFMIYKNLGTELGDILYENFCGFAFFLSILLLPQLIVSVILYRNIQELPQSLIEANMFKPQELKSGPIPHEMALPIIASIALLSVVGTYMYIKLFATKSN